MGTPKQGTVFSETPNMGVSDNRGTFLGIIWESYYLGGLVLGAPYCRKLPLCLTARVAWQA